MGRKEDANPDLSCSNGIRYIATPPYDIAAWYVTLHLALALNLNIGRFKQLELPMLSFFLRGPALLKMETCFQSGCLSSYAVIVTFLQMHS